MKKVTAFFLLSLFSYSSLAGFFGYKNYTECTTEKRAEYIDKGATVFDAFERASAYCDTKFPLLEPRYVHDHTVSAKWGKVSGESRYKIILNKECASLIFEVQMKNGEVQKFKKVQPSKASYFKTSSPVNSVTIIEALTNINQGKRVGDD